MEKSSLIRFFQNTNLVTSQKAEEISSHFSEKKLEKNEFFLKEGKVSDEYYFLESGFMRAYAIDTEADEITTNFYASNQVVFEVSSFFNRTRSKENIQALSACTGWCISYQQLNNLFHTIPEFREFGRHILVKGFSALKTRMLSMITETAETRYERLVESNPELFQLALLKHLASYLGVTDSSLSRIRKEYTKK
jgi:CRP-like cAMP-binding protein